MASITRFKEPLKFEPLQYRGLDTLEVFIEDGSADSFDYFGLTRIPRELSAGRNLISFTGTRNLVPGSEIAIEVLDANGNTIPIQTYDYIGEGNERIFAIEIGPEVPEGDALISLVGVAKGEVGFDSQRQRDASRLPPPRFRNVFNIRWQKRLNCYPRRRIFDEIIYYQNPDITIEEIKRPYFQLHYNTDLTQSDAQGNFPNSRSLFTLCSTGSEGDVNTTAKVSYQVAANKYYLVADANPDFGGFTQDMVGGTMYVPAPNNPFPSRFDSPTGTPLYNQLETGDGTGEIDPVTQQYTKQGAYNTIVSEVISPLRIRVNSPHTTFQGIGRANQREVFHQSFGDSDFRLDFAQLPISRSNPLVSGSNNFATSYAKVSFNGLTPLVGDVTRIKTFIRNDQTVTDFFLVGDNPVNPPNLLIQSSSQVERLSAGDFSPFGVSGSLNEYWSASHAGVTPAFGNDNLSIFRQLVGNVNNPIPDSLQIGNSILAHSVGQLDGTNHILVDSAVPILHQAGKYYQVEFKTFGQRVNNSTPSLKVYMYGDAINDEGDDLGQMIGQITDIDNQEIVVDEDPFNEYKTSSLRFVYKADATEFAYLRFKIEQGLWFLFDVKITPYYQYGYTPHFFDVIIPTTKANVGKVDALDFRFEFYNDAHNKALYTAELPNIEFDNEFTFTATNAFFTSASIGTFIGATPMGDNDWVKPFETQGDEAQFAPSFTGSIYHSGSVGIGNFLSADVGFPLHINKLQDEGNATIKLDSFSSSVLHLAADAGGSGLANQTNAMVIFDHNNASTSSIIGYTDTVDVDPGGAVFDGAPAGSFTIHERHAKSLALGTGGKATLIIAQDGKPDTSPRAVYIGYDDVSTGPFNPDQFGYELNVSGSIMISSGALHYPNPPGAVSTDADIVFLSYNSPHPPLSNDRGRVVSRSFRDTAASLGLGADMDWHIVANAITQSRTAAGEGRTVFIGDNNTLDDQSQDVLLGTHILQISQSGTSPASKIRISGLNELGSALTGTEVNNVLVIDSNGDVYKTGSYGVGGTGGDDLGNHTATQDLNMGGFDILNAGQIVAVSITSSHITSSTLVTTGSNIFGHAGDDSHEFIGSITASSDISGSLVSKLIVGNDISSSNGNIHGGQFISNFGQVFAESQDVLGTVTMYVGAPSETPLVIPGESIALGLNLDQAATASGHFRANRSFRVTGSTHLGSTLDVVGATSLEDELTVTQSVGIGNRLHLNKDTAQIRYMGAHTATSPAGISYKDSGGSARFALILAGDKNFVSLANRASNGSVQIRANNSTAGGGGEGVVAEFSSSEAKLQTDVSMSSNLNVEGEVFQTMATYVFGQHNTLTFDPSQEQEYFQGENFSFSAKSVPTHSKGKTFPHNGYIDSVTFDCNRSSGPTNIQGDIGVGVALFRTGSTSQTITPGIATIIPPTLYSAAGQQGEYVARWAIATQSIDMVNFPEQAINTARYGTTARFARGERPFLAGDHFSIMSFYVKNAGAIDNLHTVVPQVTVTVIFDRSGSYGNSYGGNVNTVLQS